jgi:20S proteasome subunit beta 5
MVCCVVDFAIDGFEIASGFACSEETRRGEERRGDKTRGELSRTMLDLGVLEPCSLQSSLAACADPQVLGAAPPTFKLPAVADLDGFQKAAVQMVKPAKGTTTLAFVFKHGVIVAADSRASMGNYISSQTVKKILEINRYLLGTMAGGAADCQFWQRNLGTRCRLHELANKRRISVAGASKLLANTLYSYRGMGLSMGTMIAGWDESGPGLYYVDSEGGRVEGKRFSVGSGSTYAYGVLDTGFRFDMTVDEAVELARRAIYHATFRDGASGGVASVYYVGPQGFKKMSGDDVGELHYKYYPIPEPTVEAEMEDVTTS